MNLGRIKVFSALRSTASIRSPIIAPSINLSILEANLQTCQNAREFNQIHAQMTVTGFINDTFAASRLLSFTTSRPFFDLDYSGLLLRQIEDPNTFIWNTLMRVFVQRNSAQCVLPSYKSMLQSHLFPDNYTHPILVQACSLRLSEREGKQVHTHVLELGFDADVYVQNTLMNMYSVCGNLVDARLVFNTSPVLDSVSWNSILAAYVQAGDVGEAVTVFAGMPEKNTIAANSMIVLFGRCNRVEDARKLFDEMHERDIVTWTAMVSCYEQNEMFDEALEMFSRLNGEGVMVDEVSMVTVLSVCARLGAMKAGEVIHGLIVRTGLEAYVNLHNAMIHMYSSCGNVSGARQLFDSCYYLDQFSWNSMISGYLKRGLVGEAEELFHAMLQKDVVSWSTMASGYTQHGCFPKTLKLFSEMQAEGIRPDETTLVSVISACTYLSALEQGKWVHALIKKHGYSVNIFLGTTLVDMYMKFGCVGTALEVFNDMEETGTSTWNAVIMGLAMNGLVVDSLERFSEMENHGIEPNEITFVGVLGACRHAGLVDKGRQFFNSMQKVYKLEPNVKHYGCMVDLLGRAGLLTDAEKLIENMPMAPDVATWGALLGACRKHGNTEMGERIGRMLIELEPRHDGFHVLLSDIYASKGMWSDAIELRGEMKQRGVVKTPGCSLIESNGVVHEFLAGARGSHFFDDQETEATIEAVNRHLDILRPAIKNYGGSVEVVSVEGGNCHVRFTSIVKNARTPI